MYIYMSTYSISVILPAFNEQENIREAITDIEAFMKKRFRSYEIIVVNDGSTDQTKSIVKELLRHNPHIRLVNHSNNIGYGATLRDGFAVSTKQLIFYTDADRQYDIRDLDTFLSYIPSYDIIAGYRFHRQDPAMRLFVAAVYNIMIRMLYGLTERDVDCSFKLFTRDVVRGLSLKADTGLIDVEIFIKALKQGFRLKQIPVTHFPRHKGRSTYEIGPRNNMFAFIKPHIVVHVLKEVIELWNELHK